MRLVRKATNVGRVKRLCIVVTLTMALLTMNALPSLGQRISQISNTTMRPFVTGIVPVVGPRGNAVGGISIDASGVVKNAAPEYVKELTELQREAMADIPRDLETRSQLRKISLSQLEESVAKALTDGRPIPDSIQYLGGLTRIRYLFVYPEERDVVLAGPSEPWTVAAGGSVVGKKSGRPVLQLEDLLLALRSVENARTHVISCSIDPTPEGIRQYRAFVRKRRKFSPAVVAGIKKSLGPQVVTFNSVASDSHFARVLVASDYRMKRIAMKLEPSPVDRLSSYPDLLRSVRKTPTNIMPRWWLACNYEPLGRSDDGLAWELRGAGVKAMTETNYLSVDGTAVPTGKKSSLAQRWADQFTEHYEELSKHAVVFAELRNVMDLCVIAALIEKEDLLGQAGLHIPLLSHEESPLKVGSWNAPTKIATECSFFKKGRSWIVTASGGIEIDSWTVAERSVENSGLGHVRNTARAGESTVWWWD